MSQIVTCYFENVGKATALPKLSRWIDKVTALSKTEEYRKKQEYR